MLKVATYELKKRRVEPLGTARAALLLASAAVAPLLVFAALWALLLLLLGATWLANAIGFI